MNEQNLIPNSERTPEERREIARKGGKASGVSRSFAAAWKKRIRENPELLDELLSNLIQMAQDGNAKAYELLLDMGGESVRSQELKLRKQEQKLKREDLEWRRQHAAEVDWQ